MTVSEVISDPYRTPIKAQKMSGGGVMLKAAKSLTVLSADEFDRLVALVRNEPRILRYPATPSADKVTPS